MKGFVGIAHARGVEPRFRKVAGRTFFGMMNGEFPNILGCRAKACPRLFKVFKLFKHIQQR
jgi:hypothetical protein